MREAELKRIYFLVFVLHLGLLWWLPYFPSQDGPSHIYNALILHDLLSGGAVYGAFFEATLFFTPNLGAIVPLHFLTAFLPPVVAEKVFLSAFVTLLVWIMPKLARLAGTEPFPASFMVFPLLFSRLTLHGFYSFMLGIPLWLWAMWMFWRMRSLPLWQRSLAGNTCAVVLFACHLIPFGCYVLACACALAYCSVRKPLWARLSEGAALLTLPVLLLGSYGLVLVRNTRQGNAGSIGVLPGFDVHQNFSAVLNLLTFEQVALSLGQFVSGVLLGTVALWMLCRRNDQARPSTGPAESDREQQMVRRCFLLTAVVLFAVMICVPDRIGELSLIKRRFPLLILLLVIPLLARVRVPVPLQQFVLFVSVAIALANGVLLSIASYQVQAFVTSVSTGAVRGHVVAGYRGRPANGPVDPLAHATSYFCARHGCVDIDNYQARSEQFFVRFRQKPSLELFRRLAAEPTTVEWEEYPAVEYLLGWDFDVNERRRIGQVFTILHENGEVSLWHRKTRVEVR